jgi:CheY-like chemotaxis protein
VEHKVILVVDDDMIVRTSTTLLVRHLFGFETNEAVDGLSAIERVKSSSYAAILMDCQMPHMDGFECTMKIRELEMLAGSRTPIIGLTACTDIDIRERCLKAGMDDYLEKSYSQEALVQTLAKWL